MFNNGKKLISKSARCPSLGLSGIGKSTELPFYHCLHPPLPPHHKIFSAYFLFPISSLEVEVSDAADLQCNPALSIVIDPMMY